MQGAKGLRSTTVIIRFSILGASFTGIVKNARVLSHRCDITYAGTASNLPPEWHVDHVHVHSCVMHLLHCICTPFLHLGLGNNKDIDVSLCKLRIYALHYGGTLNVEPWVPLFWLAQSLTYPMHCRRWQESLYATAITGPIRQRLHYSNTDWTYPKLVSRLNYLIA